MTDDEAQAVAKVISAVDGECCVCVGAATRELQEALPDRDWFALVEQAGSCSRELLEDVS